MSLKYRIDRTKAEGLDYAELAWVAIEPLWNAISFVGGWRATSKVFRDATAGQIGLFSLDWCQKEVRNGGFAQFFENSTGMLAPEALQGFKMIGATSYAKLLEEAIRLLPGRTAMRSRLCRYLQCRFLSSARLDSLESSFYDLLKSDDLEMYRGRYVRENPGEFFFNPQKKT